MNSPAVSPVVTSPIPPPLIECHGKCRREKAPMMFYQSEVRAVLKAIAEGRRCRPVCCQCRRDRSKRTGLYASTPFPIETPKKMPRGIGFRIDSGALCPGSRQFSRPRPVVLNNARSKRAVA